MKLVKYITLVAAAAGLAVGCQKLEMVQIDPANAVAPVLEKINPLVITEDNLEENVVFSWSEADYGTPVEIAYSIAVAYNDQKVELVSVKDTTKASVAYAKINDRLLYGLNAPADQEVEAEFYVSSKVGESQWLDSAPVVVKVKTMNAEQEKVYSEWGIVGTVNNWGNTPGVKDLLLEQEGDYFVHKGLVLTEKDEVKFRKNNAWGGDVTADPSVCKPNVAILLAGGSGNMKFEAGTYDVYINEDCSKCWFMTDGKTPDNAGGPVEPEPAVEAWGLVGDPTKWADGQDIALTEADGIWTLAEIELTTKDGFKFRSNGSWNVQLGGKDETPIESGVEVNLDNSGGSKNLKVKLGGKYKITLNPAAKTVKMELIGEPIVPEPEPEPAVEAWGLVGDPTKWADGQDIALTEADGIWTLAEIELTTKEGFKFRSNGSWDVQLGGKDETPIESGVEVNLDNSGGSNNLKVKLDGKYKITLNPAAKTVKMELIGEPI